MSQNGYGRVCVCVCLFLLWTEGVAEEAAAAFPCGARRHAGQAIYGQEEETEEVEYGEGGMGEKRKNLCGASMQTMY